MALIKTKIFGLLPQPTAEQTSGIFGESVTFIERARYELSRGSNSGFYRVIAKYDEITAVLLEYERRLNGANATEAE